MTANPAAKPPMLQADPGNTERQTGRMDNVSPPNNGQRPIIAVIDNSKAMRQMLEYCLSEKQVELVFFDTIEAASQYLQDTKPALLFINNKMPGKGGLAFLRELRQRPLHEDTTVVLVGSKDYMQDRVIAEQYGAMDFLVKPMPIQSILDVVHRALEIHQRGQHGEQEPQQGQHGGPEPQ